MQKIPNSCAINRIKTSKRLENNLYSLPINLYLELRLYAKRNKNKPPFPQSVLNNKSELSSLAQLFTLKPNHILGVDQGRSFGAFLDKQINELNEHNLVVRSGGIRSLSVAYMLFKNRVDYVIDYPSEMKLALDEFAGKITLDSVKVTTGNNYIVGYIACSKSDFGQQTIEDINKELLKLYKTPDFYQAHARYLDKADIAEFNLAYEQVFQTSIPLKVKPSEKGS